MKYQKDNPNLVVISEIAIGSIHQFFVLMLLYFLEGLVLIRL